MADMPIRSAKQILVSAPWAYGQGYFLTTVYKYSATESVVIASSVQRSDNNVGYGWRFAKKSDVWEQPEWINPPMTPNTEYRTTERISNKAVYKKSVNGVIQYRLDGETTWKPYADAVGAVSKTGDSFVNGEVGAKSLFVRDGTLDGIIDANGEEGYIRIIGINSANDDRGGIFIYRDRVVYADSNFAEHTVIHSGNMAQFFGVAPATVE